MKILYFVDGLNRGGVEMIVSQLANYFYENGNEIHIIYLYKDMHELIEEFHSGINFHPLPFKMKNRTFSQYFKYFLNLVRLLKNIQPDIIHAHNSSLSYFFLAVAVFLSKLKAKNIRTLHFSGFFLERKSIVDKIRFYFDKKASELLHTVIVSVSTNIKCYVDNSYPLNQSVLITNGIDANKICNTKMTRESLGINANCFVGIYISRICDGKNHKTLLQSWTKIVESLPSALLILVGDGPLKDDYELFCVNSGIGNNVLFTGSIPNVTDYLSIADMGIFPSESEGLSLALCEMLGAGLPVVVSDIPSFRSMLQDGKNCLFFETMNQEDLCNKIKILLSDKNLCAKLGKNAHEDILKNFTIDSMYEKYCRMYFHYFNM